MRLYEIGSSSAIESALAKDPGSYRIQMRAADYFLARGQCAKARAHALSAREACSRTHRDRGTSCRSAGSAGPAYPPSSVTTR